MSGQGERLGWERRDEVGFAGGLLSTARDFLLAPRRSAERMRVDSGLADPLLFALLLAVPALAWNLALAAGLVVSALGRAALDGEGQARLARTAWGAAALGGAIAPLAVFLALCFGALVMHLALVVVGGERRGFTATFGALAYAAGAAAPVALLPACGAPLAGLWALASAGSALAGAHGVPALRGWLAALLPLLLVLLCCGGAGGLFLALIAAAAAAAGGP